MRFFLLLALIFPLGSCQSNPPERECQCILNNLWLDVFLIIDDSTSMGSAGLLEVASNVNSVFGYSQIRVGSNYPDQRGTRVSVITYNKAATIRANLSDLNSTDQLTSMVYSLKQNDSSVSNLQEQLMMMYNDENGPRNNTRTLIIIYAGDYKDVGVPTIAQLGAQLQENLVTIVTVADISRNDRQQIEHLKSLASNGDGFNINDDYVSEEVQKAMCRDYFKSLSSQPEPYKYHIGLHYVNNGYFWEQADGLPLVPLANPLFPLPTKPVSTLQCVSNLEKMDTKEMAWSNENCFNEKRPSMCEVDACDTENYCS
uniref:VWFA domain-containing protein n=1 Tax=Caenorhabditis tropicalis TaxID=1561998 RepID=A0A1I7V4B7_9PELO